MAETFYPFDSGAGAAVTESEWYAMARSWASSGVLRGRRDEGAVSANGTAMSVSVAALEAWLEGHYYCSDAATAKTIAAAESSPRIDRVVIRLDRGAKTVGLAVLKGTAASNPSPPALTQTSLTWEAPLAQVSVLPGDAVVAAARVTDERAWAEAPGAPPAGSVQFFAGATAPAGWLLCNGATVSRATYARLFAAVGTTWGAGDGSTTFVLPDLRGRVPVGAGSGSGLTTRSLGAIGGEEATALSVGHLAAHSHGVTDPGHHHTVGAPTGQILQTTASGSHRTSTSGADQQVTWADENDATTGITTQNAGSGTAHNTMQPFAALTAIIKT